MEKYERITKKRAYMSQSEYVKRCLARLWELEDKIENGYLVEIPCKIGDTAWRVIKVAGKYVLTEMTCIRDDKSVPLMNFKTTSQLKQSNTTIYGYNPEHFGERIFKTKEEAEQKLKELEKENGN